MLSGMFMRGGKIDETKRRGEGRSVSRNNELKPSVETLRSVERVIAGVVVAPIYIYRGFDHRCARTLYNKCTCVLSRTKTNERSSVGRKKRENRWDTREKGRGEVVKSKRNEIESCKLLYVRSYAKLKYSRDIEDPCLTAIRTERGYEKLRS